MTDPESSQQQFTPEQYRSLYEDVRHEVHSRVMEYTDSGEVSPEVLEGASLLFQTTEKEKLAICLRRGDDLERGDFIFDIIYRKDESEPHELAWNTVTPQGPPPIGNRLHPPVTESEVTRNNERYVDEVQEAIDVMRSPDTHCEGLLLPLPSGYSK